MKECSSRSKGLACRSEESDACLSLADSPLYKKAAARCARKECCRADFSAMFRTAAVEGAEAEKILRSLEAEGFIDEGRYARAFVHDKLHYDRWGRRKMRAALMAKGISDSHIVAALGEIDEKLYEATLCGLLQAKRRTLKADSEFEEKAKLVRFAASRGFEEQMVFRVLDVEG